MTMRCGLCLTGVLMLAALPAPGAGVPNLDYSRLFGIASKLRDATADISREQEIAIGDKLAAMLLGAAPLVEDPDLQRHVNRVGQWLALQTERSDLTWYFGVLDTGTVNAFAAPGGYVFVTSGLLRVMQGESELAGVLAHEMAHVLRKHHLKAIKKQARAGIAAGVAGMFINRGRGLFDALAAAGTELYARGLDRDDEFEADRMGVVIAARAGYDPYGLPALLATLGGMNAQDADLSLMFSTHPPTDERLTALDEQMAGKLERYAGPRPADEPLRRADVRSPVGTPAPAAGPGTREERSHESEATVAAAQRLLLMLGYDPGPVDGRIGPRTRKALRAFEVQARLPETGRLNPKIMAILRAEADFRNARQGVSSGTTR